MHRMAGGSSPRCRVDARRLRVEFAGRRGASGPADTVDSLSGRGQARGDDELASDGCGWSSRAGVECPGRRMPSIR
ncbi:putative transcriptional regulator [Burkholderia pseudomallei]|nr:putative transcriptional regulator [Burkholderia pseudomallei]